MASGPAVWAILQSSISESRFNFSFRNCSGTGISFFFRLLIFCSMLCNCICFSLSAVLSSYSESSSSNRCRSFLSSAICCFKVLMVATIYANLHWMLVRLRFLLRFWLVLKGAWADFLSTKHRNPTCRLAATNNRGYLYFLISKV